MENILHLKKEQQQLMPLFDGAFIENKPIPFPDRNGTTAYSSLFYWAHLEAFRTSEFPLHPHEGFEIMTFVFEGFVEHFDTATKVWTPLKEGGVQVTQAGSGVQHSERITKGTKLFQIWFDPDFSKSMTKGASYKDYPVHNFKNKKINGVEHLVYLGDGGVIACDTPNIGIEKLTFNSGVYEENLDKDYTYSFYLLDGKIKVDDIELIQDDFFIFNSTSTVKFTVDNKAELFVIKSITNIEYPLFLDKY